MLSSDPPNVKYLLYLCYIFVSELGFPYAFFHEIKFYTPYSILNWFSFPSQLLQSPSVEFLYAKLQGLEYFQLVVRCKNQYKIF